MRTPLLLLILLAGWPAQALVEVHRFQMGPYWATNGEIAIEGDLLYATQSALGVVIFDISDPLQPVQLGNLTGTYYNTGPIEPAGSLLYTAHANRLRIVDVSDPSQPFLASETTLTNYSVRDLVLVGDVLYVSLRGGIEAIDVSNPQSPVSITVLPFGSDAHYLAAKGSLLVWTGGQGDGLHIVDVTDPSAPVELSFLPMAGRSTLYGVLSLGVGFSGDHVLVAVQDNASPITKETRAVDVSDPTQPFVVGVGPADGVDYEEHGGLIFAVGSGALSASDFSDPTSPRLLARLRLGFKHMAIRGETAFTLQGNEFVVVDLSNSNAPRDPQQVVTTTREIVSTVRQGHWLYAVDSWAGLRIFDVVDPTAPIQVATLPSLRNALALGIDGDRLYASGIHTGLFVVDVADPTQPALLDTWRPNQGETRGIEIRDGLAFIADRYRGLRVVDVSIVPFPPLTPTHEDPALVSETGTRGQPYDLQLVGPLAYLADGTAGLTQMDVSDPASPFMMGFWDPGPLTGGDFLALKVVGNTAHLAEEFHYWNIDVSDPAVPLLIGKGRSARLYGGSAIEVQGDFAYVANRIDGVTVFDLSDPSSPRIRHIAKWACAREVSDLHVEGTALLYPSCGIAFANLGYDLIPGPRACGLGPEVVVALGLLAGLRRRRRSSIEQPRPPRRFKSAAERSPLLAHRTT